MKAFLITYLLLLSGFFCFSQNSRISGQLTYNNTANTPLKDVKVYLKLPSGTILDSSTTTVTGYYHFENVILGQYLITSHSNEVPGGINNIDALLILKHFTGYITLPGILFTAADVNGSHNINSVDALLVAKRFVGFINSFSIPDWIFEVPTVNISSSTSVTLNFKGICVGDVNQSYLPAAVPGTPCPGLPAFEYEGQIYNTVQIGSQCWMKENLNVGAIVSSIDNLIDHSDVNNNGIIEKYCYGNNPANCEIYGGLYDWNEMMQYSTIDGSKGICPTGWHIPADEEFCNLTTFLDESVNCTLNGGSGINIGQKMKEGGISHWLLPNTGATNESGYTALGTGYRNNQGTFDGVGQHTNFFTSSCIGTSKVFWVLDNYHSNISRDWASELNGMTVRCIKDTCGHHPPPQIQVQIN